MSKLKITLVKGRYGFGEPTKDLPTNLAKNHHVVTETGKQMVRVLLDATETAAAAMKGKEVDVIYSGNDATTGFPMYQVAGATKALNNARYEQRVETALQRNATLLVKAQTIAKETGVDVNQLVGLYMQQAKNQAAARAAQPKSSPMNLLQEPETIGRFGG